MYPKLKIVTYLNEVAQLSFLNIKNSVYEFKVFLCTDSVTETEIPTSDINLVVKNHGSIANYTVASSKRYLYPLGVGSFTIEATYMYLGNRLEINQQYLIYVEGEYPKLRIHYFLDDVQQPTFLDIANVSYDFKVALYFSETEFTYLLPSDINLVVNVFDHNAFAKIESGVYKLYMLAKGTCQLGAYYTYCGQNIVVKQEILIYEGFLRDNFPLAGLTTFDYNIFQKNQRFRVLLKTLLELYDILYAYNSDIDTINDHAQIKDKFLNIAGRSFGFEKKAIYDGTKWEYSYNKMYRELLSNLLDLIKARGTKLSYELFFGAMGYDIELLEHWFDKDGNLIEINPDDFENSTFFAYDTLGTPIENIQVPHVDPRKDIEPTNKYNYCQKSIYVRPVITLKDALLSHPASEHPDYERILMMQYLEWLKPNHIEYLQTMFKINIVNTGDYIGEFLVTTVGGGSPIYILTDSISNYHVANYISLCGQYLGMDDIFITLTPLTVIPSKPANWPYWVMPVGDPINLDNSYKGPWHGQTFDETNYGDNRGLMIEHLREMTDAVVLGGVVELQDFLEQPLRYDTIYEYDGNTDPGAEEDSVGIRYDRGVVFNEADLQVINIDTVGDAYASYIQTHTIDQTLAYLASTYSLSTTQCQQIIDIYLAS